MGQPPIAIRSLCMGQTPLGRLGFRGYVLVCLCRAYARYARLHGATLPTLELMGGTLSNFPLAPFVPGLQDCKRQRDQL